MAAPIHPHRRLAKALTAGQKGGTPLRHARGVVISSNSGQTVVTLDGGTTHVTAFNYGHAANLPAGTVVDVLLVGKKAYVLGAYVPAAWQPLPLSSGVTNWGGGFQSAGYLLDSVGFVHLRGLLNLSSTAAQTVATLPSGYRPAATEIFATDVNGSAVSRVDVQADGTVYWANATSTVTAPVFFSLSGITFAAGF